MTLGHCDFGDLHKLENVVDGMKITKYETVECKIRTQGKMTQNRSRIPDRKATTPLELLHSDLAGPINPVGKDGFKYSLSFVNDYPEAEI